MIKHNYHLVLPENDSLPPDSSDSKTVIPSTLGMVKRKFRVSMIPCMITPSIYSNSPNSYDEAISGNTNDQ